MSDVRWTEPIVEMLKSLWTRGDSASQIADQISKYFGIYAARSAVIGKVHRLSLPGRKTINRKARASKLYPERTFKPYTKTSKPPMIFDDYQPQTVDVVPLNLTIFELTATTCRWPYGDVPNMKFCGHPVVADRPYCSCHTAIAYELPRKQRVKVAA